MEVQLLTIQFSISKLRLRNSELSLSIVAVCWVMVECTWGGGGGSINRSDMLVTDVNIFRYKMLVTCISRGLRFYYRAYAKS